MAKDKDKVKAKKFKIGPVGEAIVLSIAAVGVVSVVALFPGVAHIIGPFLKKEKNKQYQVKQKISRSVESLVQSGVVRKYIDASGEVRLELTQKGKWEAFLRLGSKDTQHKKWDRLWRVVVFDVPQSKDKMRRELRRAMSMYGFKMLQQSVWVYPHACDDFVALFKEQLGVSHDVLYMKVKYIENEERLRKEFKI